MIQIDPKRLIRQNEGLDKWVDAGYDGILDWYPGTGKTFGALLAIERYDKIHKATYVICVPSEFLAKQWLKSLSNLPVHLKNRIVLKTKSQLLTEGIYYKEVGLLIVDEIHECNTEYTEPLLDKSIVQHKAFLGLSGTTNHHTFRNVLKHHKIIDVINEYEAKSKGFIAEMIEYNWGLELNEREATIYENYTNLMNKLMPLFDNNLSKAQYIVYGGVNVKDGQKYQGGQWAMALAQRKGWNKNLDMNIPEHKDIDRNYNPSAFITNANLLLQIVQRRKKLLSDAKSKEIAVLALVKKFNNTKTIVFSESTRFADRVGLLLNENFIATAVFHTKLKTVMKPGKTGKLVKHGAVRLKREAMDGLANGTFKVLSTTKALDTGVNIPDLRFSIITSGTSSINQETQRKARTGRKEAESDDPVLNVNLYIKNTQDEVWLLKRQEGNDNLPIKVDKIEDISYRPQPNYFNTDDL